ncbi:MAG TPA: ABC transporter permease [Myxococcota bacterium]|nr:ABC transporter permease [Myxococcota bacterium]HNH48914.1 ABC transporter permease [Myxococcota bacterium]
MWFLLRLSFRNVLRNPGRTAITSVAVVAGVALMILGWGLVDGVDENVLRASSQTMTGDVLLRPVDYPTDGTSFPLDKAKAIPTISPVLADVAPRAFFQGRLVAGTDSTRVTGLAYDPDLDPKVFPRENWRIEGAWPSPGALELVVGSRLSRILGIHVGDSVILEARTQAGAMNALTYRVSGLLSSDNSAVDGSVVWLPMPLAEDLLILGGLRTHVALKLKQGTADEAVASLTTPGWTARTVRQECADVLELNNFRRRAIVFLVFVIMAIAATGITNSVLMGAFERVREIGALRALGMDRTDIAALFLFEGLTMGLLSALVGAVIGSGLVLRWQTHGFVLSEDMMQNAGQMAMGAEIYTRFSLQMTIGSVVFALIIAQLASIYPMIFATRLNPADAVRAE